MSIDHDVRVDSRTIEHLDFEYQVPCDHSDHEGHVAPAAMFVIEVRCRGCTDDCGEHFRCLPCWEEAGRRGIECACGIEGDREDFWVILRVIGTR